LLRRRRQMPRVPHQIAHTQLNDPEPKPFLINRQAQPGENWAAFREQKHRLREAVSQLKDELRYGFIYGLFDAYTHSIRYVGKTINRLEQRLDDHRRSHSAVGDRLATGRWLNIHPLEHPHALEEGPWLTPVLASELSRLERQEIYRYTWAGAALLNKSTNRDDGRAWQWYVDHVDDGRWSNIHQWRADVRRMPCYECTATADQPCAWLSHGANHLGRVAAHVRRRWCYDRREAIIEVARSVLDDPTYAPFLENSDSPLLDLAWDDVPHLHLGEHWGSQLGLARVGREEACAQLAMRELARLEQQRLCVLRGTHPGAAQWHHPQGDLEWLLGDMHKAYADISGIRLGPTERGI
ncbi:hypothetical protein, partial [Streptomyces sp. NPDC058622]|uniref:hypothetical protein n=1 Tax=Streptomyces sp. NPDC058622 TaxID=3346562 RepID=UPI00365EAC2B